MRPKSTGSRGPAVAKGSAMIAHLLRSMAAASCAALVAASSSSSHHPDVKAAQDHAFALFNAIHSAMRQFGSSVHHNGLSFYLAQAPEGSIFYHGEYSPERPWSFEWLAFEFEHAGIFAASWEPPHSPSPSIESTEERLSWHRMSHRRPPAGLEPAQPHDHTLGQHPLSGAANDNDDKHNRPGPHFPDWHRASRGYLHMYRANRPLNLLYIDGESAAKCNLGPMDSQDLILLDWDKEDSGSGRGAFKEIERGIDMCALAKEWSFAAGGNIDGFIRMEAGFEIIYCDWSPEGGLDLLSVQGSPFQNETGTDDDAEDVRRSRATMILNFEWLRASAARFHGQPAGRLDIDWSSMVSAFTYPVNLTNPDWTRQDLPMLSSTTRAERQNIRARLRDVVVARGGRQAAEKGVVNWQDVVDRIVTRFSKRLWWIANAELTARDLIAEVGTLINPFIDYLDHGPVAEQFAIERCAQHYIDPHLLRPQTWTPEDHAIAAAIGTVSGTICRSLFAAREVLRSNETRDGFESPSHEARVIVQRLIDDLRWSTWRECGACAADEICSIPMFPVGSKEDYFHPTCKNMSRILESNEYWGLGAPRLNTSPSLVG